MDAFSLLRRHSIPFLLIVCMAGAFLPTYIELSDRVWSSDEGSHGPLILAAVLWLTWIDRSRYLALCAAGSSRWGWLVLVIGLVSLALGRSQSFLSIEMLSQIAVIAACLLLMGG